MDRRTFVSAMSAGALLAIAPGGPALASRAAPVRTRWRVAGSEGFDAIAFLGALSGREIYRRTYAADADRFAPRLPAEVRADVPRLADEAEHSSFGLLWPVLANILSGAGVTTLDSVVDLLADPEKRVRPAFLRNPGREDADMAWLTQHAERLRRVFIAMRDAGFAEFRREKIGPAFADRIDEVSRSLSAFDVIRWQERFTGRRFDPVINVVLLAFSKPHGAKMQGQTFLQSFDYGVETTVRIAAHEMLHPPIPPEGNAAKAALDVLAKDPLLTRVVRDHDPQWGYTTLPGLLDEDICEALDQLVGEALGVARDPAERWRKADDGMHVLAGGLYGLLRQDRWHETGGDIQAWILRAARTGRLSPPALHQAAATVLKRPVDQLWPLTN